MGCRSVHAYIISSIFQTTAIHIVGVNLEEFKDTKNLNLIELFEGVRDAAFYTIINKRCYILRYRCCPARNTKAILDDENAVSSTESAKAYIWNQ